MIKFLALLSIFTILMLMAESCSVSGTTTQTTLPSSLISPGETGKETTPRIASQSSRTFTPSPSQIVTAIPSSPTPGALQAKTWLPRVSYFVPDIWEAGVSYCLDMVTQISGKNYLIAIANQADIMKADPAFPGSGVSQTPDSGGGILIADLSEPDDPVSISFLVFPGGNIPIDFVQLVGTTLYVVSDGLQIIDISDPYHPRIRGSFPGIASEIAVLGHYVYYIDNIGSSIKILDVTDPSHIKAIGTLNPTLPPYQILSPQPDRIYTHIFSMQIMNSELFVLFGQNNYFAPINSRLSGTGFYTNSGIHIYDISSQPAAPREIAYFPAILIHGYQQYSPDLVSPYFIDMQLNSKYAFISYPGVANIMEFQVVDISDPTHPAEVPQNPDLGSLLQGNMGSGYTEYLSDDAVYFEKRFDEKTNIKDTIDIKIMAINMTDLARATLRNQWTFHNTNNSITKFVVNDSYLYGVTGYGNGGFVIASLSASGYNPAPNITPTSTN